MQYLFDSVYELVSMFVLGRSATGNFMSCSSMTCVGRVYYCLLASRLVRSSFSVLESTVLIVMFISLYFVFVNGI
jgi:hypothetical protein